MGRIRPVLLKTSDQKYTWVMTRVPIAEFKANCSRYVEEASEEDIVITKHGKAVARLIAERAPKMPWERRRTEGSRLRRPG